MTKEVLKEINKLKKSIEAAQEKLEASEFIIKNPGIKVILQGTRQIIDIEIKKNFFQDNNLLQKAILETINQGLTKIDKAQEKNVVLKNFSLILDKI